MWDILSMALRSGGEYRSPWPDMRTMIGPLADQGPISGKGRYGFVLLQLVREDNEHFVQNSEAIDTLRGISPKRGCATRSWSSA